MSTTIAQIILQQLGARMLCDLRDGLQFALPRGAKNKANRVCIRLAALFTEQTGFDTHL